MLEVRECGAKGRGVFATRNICAGEVVLRELPLLLYPQQGTAAAFCSHCLRAFNSLGKMFLAQAGSMITTKSAEAAAPALLAAAACCLAVACRLPPWRAGRSPAPMHPCLASPFSPYVHFLHADENAAAVVPCATCGQVGFCGPACAAAAAADPGSHCPAVCRLLAACNLSGLNDDQQTALQFLARCCSLRAAAAAGDAAAAPRLAAILSLVAPTTTACPDACDGPGGSSSSGCSLISWSDSRSTELRELHGRLSFALAAAGGAVPAVVLSLDEVAELLRRDAANGYGVMAPSAPDVRLPLAGERNLVWTS